jgi:hypothetical protein
MPVGYARATPKWMRFKNDNVAVQSDRFSANAGHAHAVTMDCDQVGQDSAE